MGVIREFFDYIRAPYFSEEKEKFTLKSLGVLGKLLAYKLLFAVIAYIFLTHFLELASTEKPVRLSSSSTSSQSFKPGRLIRTVLIFPFLEELFFRSWLRKRWGVKYVFPITTTLAAWMISVFFVGPLPQFYIWTILIGLICYLFFVSQIPEGEDNTHFVDRMFPYAFWVSALAFALIHLTNFKAEGVGLLAVVVVLPQFIGGAFYGYITYRFGFWASVGAHMFWNGSLMSVAYLYVGG